MAKLDKFKTLNETELSTVEGGVGPWIIRGGVLAYGVLVGYTSEKCRMDNGHHWYCFDPEK